MGVAPEFQALINQLVQAIRSAGALPTVEDRLNNWSQSMQVEAFYKHSYKVLTLNLATARDDSDPLQVSFKGNSVALIYLTGASPQVNLRYIDKGRDMIPLYQQIAISRPYRDVFFSWPASVGGEAVILLSTSI